MAVRALAKRASPGETVLPRVTQIGEPSSRRGTCAVTDPGPDRVRIPEGPVEPVPLSVRDGQTHRYDGNAVGHGRDRCHVFVRSHLGHGNAPIPVPRIAGERHLAHAEVIHHPELYLSTRTRDLVRDLTVLQQAELCK